MLPDFRLESYFSRWEFAARYHLCASDMESMTIDELLGLAGVPARQFLEMRLGYTETFGAPDLREAIAAGCENMSAENVLTFAGAEEGIFVAMQVLLDKEDHAIVITPNYQAAETIPAGICEVSGVALDANRDWALDLDAIHQAIKPNTKLISINFPHNPTGKVIPREDLAGLIEIARKSGIYVFSDEVYRLLEINERHRLPQVADTYERGLSLNVMSKAYGLPGLRIGWIVTQDKELLQRMERAKHYLSICNSGPSEFLATVALGCGAKILRRNRALISANLQLMSDFFAAEAELFEWSVPGGGCIAYPRYKGPEGVERFCQELVEKAGVLLLPASVFHSDLTPTPTDRFRIGFGRANTDACLVALHDYLH